MMKPAHKLKALIKAYNDDGVKVKKGFLERSALYDYYFSGYGVPFINKIQDYSNQYYYLSKYASITNNKVLVMNDSKNKLSFMVLE